MTDTPPDWILIEAAKRWHSALPAPATDMYRNHPGFTALCDMIQKYEQPPVDRKLLCAREACAENSVHIYGGEIGVEYRAGKRDDTAPMECSIRAIELWEEGFGSE